MPQRPGQEPVAPLPGRSHSRRRAAVGSRRSGSARRARIPPVAGCIRRGCRQSPWPAAPGS